MPLPREENETWTGRRLVGKSGKSGQQKSPSSLPFKHFVFRPSPPLISVRSSSFSSSYVQIICLFLELSCRCPTQRLLSSLRMRAISKDENKTTHNTTKNKKKLKRWNATWRKESLGGRINQINRHPSFALEEEQLRGRQRFRRRRKNVP